MKFGDVLLVSKLQFFYILIELVYTVQGLFHILWVGHHPFSRPELEAEVATHLLLGFFEAAAPVEAVGSMEAFVHVQLVLFDLEHGFGHLDAM